MDSLEKDLHNLKCGNVYKDFCVNDALQHLDKIKEALEAMETNPKKFYKESIEHTKWIMKMMPVVYLLDGFQPPTQE
jgi:hypothetical protein